MQTYLTILGLSQLLMIIACWWVIFKNDPEHSYTGHQLNTYKKVFKFGIILNIMAMLLTLIEVSYSVITKDLYSCETIGDLITSTVISLLTVGLCYIARGTVDNVFRTKFHNKNLYYKPIVSLRYHTEKHDLRLITISEERNIHQSDKNKQYLVTIMYYNESDCDTQNSLYPTEKDAYDSVNDYLKGQTIKNVSCDYRRPSIYSIQYIQSQK